MPCFDSPYGYLRAKACWVAGQYADIEFQAGAGQGPAFSSLFQKVVDAFQDPDLPVRALPTNPKLPLLRPPNLCSVCLLSPPTLTLRFSTVPLQERKEKKNYTVGRHNRSL